MAGTLAKTCRILDLIGQETWDCDTLHGCLVSIDGQEINVRLEADLWSALLEICSRERSTLNHVFTSLAHIKPVSMTLDAAARSFILNYFRAASTEDGHRQAGHGRPSEHKTAWLN